MCQACNFIEKETSTQVFSYEFCEVFKKTFFTKHLWTTASALDDFYFHTLHITGLFLYPHENISKP